MPFPQVLIACGHRWLAREGMPPACTLGTLLASLEHRNNSRARLEALERGLLHGRVGVQQLPRDGGAHCRRRRRGAQAGQPRQHRQPAAHVLPPGPAPHVRAGPWVSVLLKSWPTPPVRRCVLPTGGAPQALTGSSTGLGPAGSRASAQLPAPPAPCMSKWRRMDVPADTYASSYRGRAVWRGPHLPPTRDAALTPPPSSASSSGAAASWSAAVGPRREAAYARKSGAQSAARASTAAGGTAASAWARGARARASAERAAQVAGGPVRVH
jgi:hypothetical protein